MDEDKGDWKGVGVGWNGGSSKGKGGRTSTLTLTPERVWGKDGLSVKKIEWQRYRHTITLTHALYTVLK